MRKYRNSEAKKESGKHKRGSYLLDVLLTLMFSEILLLARTSKAQGIKPLLCIGKGRPGSFGDHNFCHENAAA